MLRGEMEEGPLLPPQSGFGKLAIWQLCLPRKFLPRLKSLLLFIPEASENKRPSTALGDSALPAA